MAQAYQFNIGFGFQENKHGEHTYLLESNAANMVEQAAREAGVPGYSVHFGPGCWTNEKGDRVREQGGCVTIIGEAGDGTRVRKMAVILRDLLEQEAVIYWTRQLEAVAFI